MVSPIFKVATGWIGWRFIPDFVSIQLLSLFYKFYQGILRRQPPAPNTPEYLRHRRWAYSIVVFGYALYTFREAATSIGANYYELLGIHPTADDGDLKLGFRSFAKRYHPDRAGQQYETLFMDVRDAYEALKNPVSRFAYDRFGPSALKWKDCNTIDEYISHGLYQSSLYYVVSVCALLLLSKFSSGALSFWHYVILFATFAYELIFILSPSPSEPSGVLMPDFLFVDPIAPSHSTLLHFFWPDRVAYQHIIFIKSLSLLCSTAIHQVVPAMFPPSVTTLSTADFMHFMSMVDRSAKNVDQEVNNMVHTELHSYQGEPTGTTPSSAEFANITPAVPPKPIIDLIKPEFEDLMVERILLGQAGPLRTACDTAVQRRRRITVAPRHSSRAAPRIVIPARRPRRPLEFASSKTDVSSDPGYVRGRSMSY